MQTTGELLVAVQGPHPSLSMAAWGRLTHFDELALPALHRQCQADQTNCPT